MLLILNHTKPMLCICRYNTSNFDLPYLINRAAALGLTKFPYWGRLKNKRVPLACSSRPIVLPSSEMISA